MADVAWPLVSKLHQVAVTEGKALAGVGNEIERLRDKLMWLHVLVHEMDLRRRNGSDQMANVLACQLREVAFEAEDAVDSFFLEDDHGHDWCRAAAKFFVNFGTQIRVRCILSGKIKSMNARLEGIVDNSAKYWSQYVNTESSAAITWWASSPIPSPGQNWLPESSYNLYLEHEIETKEKELEGHLNKEESLVICVVGESGVGKRRLVKEACENETIMKKFKVRIWESFPPDTDNITDQIKSKLGEITRKLEDECSMLPQNLDQVYDYLVVVDLPTTQSTTVEISNLQELLKVRKGSKIVLTATSYPPADAENVVIVELGYLDKRLSVTLFNRELGLGMRRKSAEKTERMNLFRDHIEDMTNGLPLAVILLARVMRTMNINKWKVASNYLRNNHQDKFKMIVYMCIDDLPREYKSCLLYTAGFPARSKMDAGQLVRLWMAEGFLAQQHGVEPEVLGQQYLKEFIFRGLVQVVKGDTVKPIALHDRVHEILRSEAQRTGFMETHSGGSAPLPDSARRLALNSKKLPDKNMVLTKLRTVLSHGHDHDGHHHAQGSWPEFKDGFRQLLKHSTFLRVISLEGIDIGEKLPNQMGNMLHLQYLGVRRCNLKKVPGSIGKLRKLQTMDVRGTEVKKLPKSFWKIKALRQVLGEHDLEFPESAERLVMLNGTVSVLPTTATEPEQSTGEAERTEYEECVMPPQAARHLETLSVLPTTAGTKEPEPSTGEADKAESEESVMPPQAQYRPGH